MPIMRCEICPIERSILFDWQNFIVSSIMFDCYSRKKEKVREAELQGCGRHCQEPLAGASRFSLT